MAAHRSPLSALGLPDEAAAAAAAAPPLAATTDGGLAKRILIPLTANSPAGLVQAWTIDPWTESGKYGRGWTYFALSVAFLAVAVRMWHYWQDKIRQAIYKQEMEEHFRKLYTIEPGWDRSAALATGYQNPATTSTDQQQQQQQPHPRSPARHFFPEDAPPAVLEKHHFSPKAHLSSVGWVNDTLALFRWVFYRPIPDVRWRKHRFTFSSSAVLFCVLAALCFVTVYSFLLQPLYWQSIRFGSPPLAVRSGMVAVATTPWIMATATKSNVLTLVTGIGPDRLNVFHRWLGYLCFYMSLVHMVPFLVQPVWEDGGMAVFGSLFPPGSGIIYGSGVACIVPLFWLCAASLPVIRRHAYETFALLHWPVGLVYVGMLFWHTKNALMTWDYLYASLAIWAVCQLARLRNLNWVRPWRRLAWLTGDEAAINIMAEDTIKVTIPTQMRWRPGQHVYLRMPGISMLQNHPFTITSLCSDDFPSEYGESYRDCVLVFRPYGGFTRRLLETAVAKGPYHTYRAFLDGPYGGMRRDLAAFDTCILIAGGSGITSLMSQLLNLIKRMRDAKAITKRVVVVWAMRRLEAMDWFREELRICRESAPPESVTCKFFVTQAVRQRREGRGAGDVGGGAVAGPSGGGGGPTGGSGVGGGGGGGGGRAPRPLSNMFHDKLDGFVAGIADKRSSALIAAEAAGDPEREQQLRSEDEDRLTSLPRQKYLQPYQHPPRPPPPPSLQNHNQAAAATTGPQDNKPRGSPTGGDRREQFPADGKGKQKDDNGGDGNGNGNDDGLFHFRPRPPRDGQAPHVNYAPPAGRQRYSQYLEAEAGGGSSSAGAAAAGREMMKKKAPSPAEDEDDVDAITECEPHQKLNKQDDGQQEHDQPQPQQHSQQSQPQQPQPQQNQQDNEQPSTLQPPGPAHLRTKLPPSQAAIREQHARSTLVGGPPAGFDFGFPATPTDFQRSLMRFAFPVPHRMNSSLDVSSSVGGSRRQHQQQQQVSTTTAADGGWTVEYGRPDLEYMLREWATGGADGRGILGRRTAVFVCGPPAMRVGVANATARLQAEIWGDPMLEEIFLHAENYAL